MLSLAFSVPLLLTIMFHITASIFPTERIHFLVTELTTAVWSNIWSPFIESMIQSNLLLLPQNRWFSDPGTVCYVIRDLRSAASSAAIPPPPNNIRNMSRLPMESCDWYRNPRNRWIWWIGSEIERVRWRQACYPASNFEIASEVVEESQTNRLPAGWSSTSSHDGQRKELRDCMKNGMMMRLLDGDRMKKWMERGAVWKTETSERRIWLVWMTRKICSKILIAEMIFLRPGAVCQ